MKQLLLIWYFYQPYAIYSLAITTFIGFINLSIGIALLIKAFLIVLLWYFVKETPKKRKLVFYQNFGINSFKLFSIIYLIDCIVTICFLSLFKCFS